MMFKFKQLLNRYPTHTIWHAIASGLGLAILMTPTQAVASDAELHTFHCLHGCPLGAPGIDDIIVREIYTLASNDLTRIADWVAYRVTPSTIGPSQSRNWNSDPWLDEDETLEEEDYDGANAALGTDRGHQAPLAAFSGTEFWPETNFLSNITPQVGALNQGPWQRLEGTERDLASAENLAVYVLTGPLFERVMAPLPGADERHRIPSAYWKVIITEDGRIASFIMDQKLPRSANHCDSAVSLDEVELRSRLAFFPRLVERNFTELLPALGCGQQ